MQLFIRATLVFCLLFFSSVSAHAETVDGTDSVTNGEAPSRKSRIVSAIAGASGIALFSAAFAYNSAASQDERMIEQAAAAHTPWDQEQMDLDKRGKRRAVTALVLTGAGATATFVAVIAYFWEHGEQAGDWQVRSIESFAPTPGHTAGLSLGVSF